MLLKMRLKVLPLVNMYLQRNGQRLLNTDRKTGAKFWEGAEAFYKNINSALAFLSTPLISPPFLSFSFHLLKEEGGKEIAIHSQYFV
jgi:hypothetical protein